MWISVDIESDGPAPGIYSMIEIGAVAIDTSAENGIFSNTFYASLCPITDNFDIGALKVIGTTRKETLSYDNPMKSMARFERWLNSITHSPHFISDNNGYDWMFVCYYFHKYLGFNPFGHNSTNLASLYKGIKKNMYVDFKHLRTTKHTHNPVDDAMGNAEAFVRMATKLGLAVNLI